MSFTVGKYEFDGPFSSTNQLQDRSGIYVIVCAVNNQYQPLDCGESATVKSRVEDHERADCWKRNCNGTLMVAVLYTPNTQSAGRVAIEQEIRGKFAFPCGQR